MNKRTGDIIIILIPIVVFYASRFLKLFEKLFYGHLGFILYMIFIGVMPILATLMIYFRHRSDNQNQETSIFKRISQISGIILMIIGLGLMTYFSAYFVNIPEKNIPGDEGWLVEGLTAGAIGLGYLLAAYGSLIITFPFIFGVTKGLKMILYGTFILIVIMLVLAIVGKLILAPISAPVKG